MGSAASAYPLAWPAGWPRSKSRKASKFKVTFAEARDELQREIKLLGGRYPVLSTNVELRVDGQPRASARAPDDPAVAVYFERAGKQMVFACDRWDSVKDNIRAIQKTIEAMRGTERWGASDMMERAFAAFIALPPASSDWRSVLGLTGTPSRAEIETAYRTKAKSAHPDAGGSDTEMAKLNAARVVALQEPPPNG